MGVSQKLGVPTIMENQMEKKMKNEMESKVYIRIFMGFSKIRIPF